MPLPAVTCEPTSWRLEQPKNLLIPVHSSQECHCVFCTYSSSAVVSCLLDDVNFIKLAVVKLLTHIKFRLNVHFSLNFTSAGERWLAGKGWRAAVRVFLERRFRTRNNRHPTVERSFPCYQGRWIWGTWIQSIISLKCLKCLIVLKYFRW